MVVKSMDLASLVPYERNPRKRPKEAVAAVAESLKKFGWQQPIVVDSKNVISVGHTRHAAALSLGWTTAPVVVIPDDQAAAYRLVDNRSGEFTVWDNDLLRAELDALPSLDGFDLEVFDFDALLKPARGLTDPDDIPETPKNPVARTGDLWVLGKHRIVCGDSTNHETVERLLDGAEPDLMVTDPPYGVNYDAEWRYREGLNTKRGAYGKSTNDDTSDWQAAYALFPGSIAYVWMSSLGLQVAAIGLDACSFIRRSLIIWDKGHIVPSRRSLQLETRVVLVRRQEGRESQLAGRAQSLDHLGDRETGFFGVSGMSSGSVLPAVAASGNTSSNEKMSRSFSHESASGRRSVSQDVSSDVRLSMTRNARAWRAGMVTTGAPPSTRARWPGASTAPPSSAPLRPSW